MSKIDYFSWIPTTLEGVSASEAPLLFDIETNGLLPDLTTIHCVVIHNPVSGETISAHGDAIPAALDTLAAAPVLVGHNILCFDLPAIKKVHPQWQPQGHVFDTLNATRLIWPDIKTHDFNALKRGAAFPKSLIGSHSLKAWGFRLGVLKGEFGEQGRQDGGQPRSASAAKTALFASESECAPGRRAERPMDVWSCWTPEMQAYCEQDVTVTTALFAHILKQRYSQEALALEMLFQAVMQRQEEYGFPFDTAKAQALYAELAARRAELYQELQDLFPPREVREVFVPKVNNRVRGYIKDQPFIKRRIETFNPQSGYHIAERLRDKYGWVPASHTPTGEPALDDEVLSSLSYPEAALLCEYRELAKIIGMLAEGRAGWLKLVTPQGRIHGRVLTNGAVTGRCTHSRPNLAQVPKRGALGQRCRELFHAPAGYVMVGADASGLELRVFGHYLARYDNGKYAEEVIHGDIHTANQKAIGLPSRDEAKTWIYRWLYGGGPALLGSSLCPDGTEIQKRKAGLAMSRRFLARNRAVKQLKDQLAATLQGRSWLKGVDGRRLHVRSRHSALNLIFQSAGSLLVKLATVLWHRSLEARGWTHGKDYAQVAHVHDEVQAVARPEIAEEVGRLFVAAIEEAGRHFAFRVPMTGEYSLGNTWRETH